MDNIKRGEVGWSRVWRSGKSSQSNSNGVYHDVCHMRRVGGKRRKGSEWWNEVGGAVPEK